MATLLQSRHLRERALSLERGGGGAFVRRRERVRGGRGDFGGVHFFRRGNRLLLRRSDPRADLDRLFLRLLGRVASRVRFRARGDDGGVECFHRARRVRLGGVDGACGHSPRAFRLGGGASLRRRDSRRLRRRDSRRLRRRVQSRRFRRARRVHPRLLRLAFELQFPRGGRFRARRRRSLSRDGVFAFGDERRAFGFGGARGVLRRFAFPPRRLRRRRRDRRLQISRRAFGGVSSSVRHRACGRRVGGGDGGGDGFGGGGRDGGGFFGVKRLSTRERLATLRRLPRLVARRLFAPTACFVAFERLGRFARGSERGVAFSFFDATTRLELERARLFLGARRPLDETLARFLRALRLANVPSTRLLGRRGESRRLDGGAFGVATRGGRLFRLSTRRRRLTIRPSRLLRRARLGVARRRRLPRRHLRRLHRRRLSRRRAKFRRGRLLARDAKRFGDCSRASVRLVAFRARAAGFRVGGGDEAIGAAAFAIRRRRQLAGLRVRAFSRGTRGIQSLLRRRQLGRGWMCSVAEKRDVGRSGERRSGERRRRAGRRERIRLERDENGRIRRRRGGKKRRR